MRITDPNSHPFHGQVKYTGLNAGSVKWKTGAIVLTKGDLGWKLDVVYDCTSNGRPALSVQLNALTLKKVVCKDTGFILNHKTPRDYTTIFYRPTHKSQVKPLQTIMDDIQSGSYIGAVLKSEVGIQRSDTTPSKPLQNGYYSNQEKENQQFTSVKENRYGDKSLPIHELFGDGSSEEEGKENQTRTPANKSENPFLNKGSEKSRQCLSSIGGFYGKGSASSQPLYNSTPNTNNSWLNAKRQPGLMPDPTPIKRARLSDAIPYSMKPKPTTLVDQKQQQSLQGFSNLGNTCYMNAILQSLFGLDTFSSDLTYNRRLLKALSTQSLYHALVRLFHARRQQVSTDINKRECLRRVKSAISSSAKRFSGYGQHDAHEFLGQVLDQLKEEVNKMVKATPSPSNKENVGGDSDSPLANRVNPINVNFEFDVLHTITCLQCREQLSKTEQFLDVSLDLPKRKDMLTPRSLQDALGLFFRDERIEYTCEKCGHNQSDVSHKVTRLPRIFILHLKRYSYNQAYSTNMKMGQNVLIPQYMTLENHCIEATQPAFPVESHDLSYSDQKSLLNDSRDDTPSRRKLDYPSFRFNKKGLTTSTDSNRPSENNTSSLFTETKSKSDEPDCITRAEPDPITRAQPITLEDEVDADYARAIEMSIKEQEEREQRIQDYGDSEETLEHALELSRQGNQPETHKQKNIKDLTEEEMIQLAIEQSLTEADPYYHGNYTQSDDVIKSDDHNYTGFDDVILSANTVSEGGYDIGPDHVIRHVTEQNGHVNRENDHVTFKNGDQSFRSLNNEHNGDSISEKYRNLKNSNFTQNDDKNTQNDDIIFSDVATPPQNTTLTSDLEISSEDSLVLLSDDDNNRENQTKITDHLQTSIKSPRSASKKMFSDRLKKITSTFSSDEDSQSNGNVEQSESVDSKSTLRTDLNSNCIDKHDQNNSENQVKDFTQNSKQDTEMEDLNQTVKHETDINVIKEEIVATPLQRKCQLMTNNSDTCSKSETTNGNTTLVNGTDTEAKGDNFDDFGCDEDDSWMYSVEDKENKLPDKPCLSDPAMECETGLSTTEEVEEDLDLPEINNEKGDLPYSYRLVSIVNHVGMSTSTGHYLSDVYDMKKKGWFSFDDSHVTRIPESEVRTKRERSGYIFFYMSKDIFDDLAIQHAVNASSKKTD